MKKKKRGGRIDWNGWTLQMAAFVRGVAMDVRGLEMAGRVTEMRIKDVDWLGVAIGNLGGPAPAARALKVSRQYIHRWINDGIADVSFAKISELSKLADVPMEYLARRMGPIKLPPALPRSFSSEPKTGDEG